MAGAAAVTALLGLAPPRGAADIPGALNAAKPPAGYTPIKTGQGMCLDDTAGSGRNGQPVQLWKCLGNRNQAWQAQPDGTLRNANGTRLVMVSCAGHYFGSYWTVNAFAHQIMNKYAVAAMDNRENEQRDGNPVELYAETSDLAAARYWTAVQYGGRAPTVSPGHPPALHTDGANTVTAANQVFVPRGFSLSALEYTAPYLDGASVRRPAITATWT